MPAAKRKRRPVDEDVYAGHQRIGRVVSVPEGYKAVPVRGERPGVFPDVSLARAAVFKAHRLTQERQS